MSRQQKWAEEALKRVRKHKGTDSESKYRTLCLKMPALLKQSGLVQSLAFIRARSGEIGKDFCNELAAVYGVQREDQKSAGEVLQERSQSAALPVYLVLSRDLIEVSVWFRRFAQAELRESEEKSDKPIGGADAGAS